MSERHYLHFWGLVTYLSVPVEVLSRGPKRARVRACHRYRFRRKWVERGSTFYVDSGCLSDKPWRDSMVSRGGGRFS